MNTEIIIKNYRDDKELRNKFFAFIDQVFPSADFHTWHAMGFWSDEYIPYSIFEDDKIVANVSVSLMDLILKGKAVKAIQFGTVGTLPDYTGRDYSRQLMELTLNRYQNEIDTMFLFANESVVDFYPKFGFEQHYESSFIKKVELDNSRFRARPLSIENESDRAIVRKLLGSRRPLTERFGAKNYDFVFYWHWINSFPSRLLYLEKEDVIFITTERDGLLNVWDVISKKPFDVIASLPHVIQSDIIASVTYHFPPDVYDYVFDEVTKCEDSLLFVRGVFLDGTQPFKFPTTAET